jgi:MFS family permease
MSTPGYTAIPSLTQHGGTRKTAWGAVLIAIGAGILAGVQVGKAHIALPSIRGSFALRLVDASWILSALSFVGLFVATPIGSLARRVGTKGAVEFGLLIMAAASAAGSAASSAKWLIVSRFIEGLGFVLVVVAAPSLICDIAEPRHLRIALAGWATFMPAGVALATLLTPLLLAHHSWRSVWIADAAALAVYAFTLVHFGIHQNANPAVFSETHLWHDLWVVATARGPVLLALIFALYTLLHLGIMGLLPTILAENYRVQQHNIGILASSAMASNILGNLAAGVLLQRGASRSLLIGAASAAMALMTIGMFSVHLSFGITYLCCFVFSCVGGVIPATVISAAPFYSPNSALLPATNGILVQGSNLGIVVGPPLISSIATYAGWKWVPALTVAAAAAATTLAIILGRRNRSQTENLIGRDLEMGIH